MMRPPPGRFRLEGRTERTLFLGYKGVCLQQFYQQREPATQGFLEEAKVSLEKALVSEAPLKRKLYYLIDV